MQRAVLSIVHPPPLYLLKKFDRSGVFICRTWRGICLRQVEAIFLAATTA